VTEANAQTGDWAGRRVLVTGGAGFIGSALVWALNQRGCAAIVIADFPPNGEKQRNLAALRFEKFVEADRLLALLGSGTLGAFDHIFHLGACSSTTETDEAYLERNNFEYTRDLAAWALAKGVRFTYASSAATYGDGTQGMDDVDPRQLARLEPLNAYARSKQKFDLYAWQNGTLDQMAGLKYFNVFGPNEYHKADMRSVVLKAYLQIQDTGRVKLFKSYRPEYRDGEQVRDFLYVKDAVAITLHLAASVAPAAAGLFNVGSGEAHTWNDLARCVFRAMGKDVAIDYVDMPEAIRERYQYATKADIGKLRRTGYSDGITSLRDAVRDYVVNYLATDTVLGGNRHVEEP
jgi:ADP-L-glycero-D-manno-heptose 6-epimerase